MSALARSRFTYECCRSRANAALLRRLLHPPSKQTRKEKGFLADDLTKAADAGQDFTENSDETTDKLAGQVGMMVGEDGWLCKRPDAVDGGGHVRGVELSSHSLQGPPEDTTLERNNSPGSLEATSARRPTAGTPPSCSRPGPRSHEGGRSPANSEISILSSVDELVLRHPPPELQPSRECGCDS